MELLNFLGSILGGLIGGIFTYLGVVLTIKHQEKIRKLDEEEKIKKAKEKEKLERPRLEIVSFKKLDNCGAMHQCDADFAVVILKILRYDVNPHNDRPCFYYDERALKIDNLSYVNYTMKNIGMTEIVDVCATINLPRAATLVNYENLDFIIKEKMLNYDGYTTKRYIKPGETFSFRVYYINNQILGSSFGNPTITLWLYDINGNLWKQAISSPTCEIENSIETSYKELDNARDINIAIDCFRNPNLW